MPILGNHLVPQMVVKYRYLDESRFAPMDENDTSMAIGNPRTEFDDPISSLLVVINKLIDLESRMDYESSTIQEIQDNLRTIIDLLERSKNETRRSVSTL